jgi:hypothetical protein
VTFTQDSIQLNFLECLHGRAVRYTAAEKKTQAGEVCVIDGLGGINDNSIHIGLGRDCPSKEVKYFINIISSILLNFL